MRTGISRRRGPSHHPRARPAARRGDAAGARRRSAACCSETVVSTRPLPPLDNSAMDGFAAARRGRARAPSAARPVALPVAFEIPAGDPAARAPARRRRAHPHRRAAAARRRQRGAAGGHRSATATRCASASRRGWATTCAAPARTCEVGDAVIARRHAALGPPHVGMLTSLGRGFVAVRRRPRVAILSGGDELVEPDGDVAGGRIVASNSWSIAAQCRELGAEPVYLGIARDRPDDIERRLRGGLACDVLVTLGGRLGRRPRLRARRAREARLHAALLGRADQAGLSARVRRLRGRRAGRWCSVCPAIRSRRW